jgi:glycosyltransferase involved in cell wall biosynthesis
MTVALGAASLPHDRVLSNKRDAETVNPATARGATTPSLSIAMLLANPGNADARVQKEAESLAAAGHRVTVYCLAATNLPRDEMRAGVRYTRCVEPHRRWFGQSDAPAMAAMLDAPTAHAGRQSPARMILGSLRRLASTVKRAVAPFVMHELHARTFVTRVTLDRPDVVHAHDFEVLPAAVRIAKATRAAVVYDMHEYELGRLPVPHPLLARWKRRIERNAVRYITAAITVSPSIAKLFATTYQCVEPTLILNAPVVSNEPAVQPARTSIPTLRTQLGLDAQTPLAVQVGTSAPGRGIESLLAALARLPRLHLALVGSIRPELAVILDRAQADPNLSGRLHIVPPVPHDAVVPFIASADVGICAVRPICLNYEFCLPNKLFEMTLAGLPLVVSKTRDVARFVTETGNGIVTDTGDPAALAAAITRAIAQRDTLKPDARTLAMLRQRYAWQAQATKLVNLYDRIGEQRQALADAALAVRRRILMVNLIEWDKMCGGAQHQLGLFGAWSAVGHSVEMLSPQPKGSGSSYPEVLAGRVHTVPSLRTWGMPASFDTLAQCAALMGLARQGRPDLVYSRHNALTPFLVLTCRLLRLPVMIEHNSWLPSQRRVDGGSEWLARLEGFGQTLATRWANGARTVTPGLAKKLTSQGVPSDQIVAIGNGTDVARFFPMDRAEAFATFNLEPARTTVGFIGNIMPWHGLDQALTGFAAAAAMLGDIDLVIFGDGPGVPALQAQAAELGLQHRVRFMGRVPLEQANAAINCMDIALLPLSARHDIGFGFSAIKLRDYAAAGRIVLTGRLPGAIELEDEPWLFTHEPDNGQDLGLKLTRLLIDRARQPAARIAARRYAQDHFDWRVIGHDIEKFMARRLSENPLFAMAMTGSRHAAANAGLTRI